MKKITVISPVFNEKSVIRIFYNSLTETLDKIKNNYTFEILFVIDKSTDKTFEVITEIAKENNNVKAILLSRRFGHQIYSRWDGPSKRWCNNNDGFRPSTSSRCDFRND